MISRKSLLRFWQYFSFLFFLILGAAKTFAFAESDSLPDSTLKSISSYHQPSSLSAHYFKLLLITIVLLIIFYLSLRLMRKLQYGKTVGGMEQVHVLRKTYLTSKHSLWVIVVNGNKYLLGITDHSINLIDQLGPATEEELKQMNLAALPSFGSFIEKLRHKNN